MNRRAEALNPAAEQTLRAPKYEASSIFTLVAQSERYLYPIYLSLISFRRIKQRPESAVKTPRQTCHSPEVSKPLGSASKRAPTACGRPLERGAWAHCLAGGAGS